MTRYPDAFVKTSRMESASLVICNVLNEMCKAGATQDERIAFFLEADSKNFATTVTAAERWVRCE